MHPGIRSMAISGSRTWTGPCPAFGISFIYKLFCDDPWNRMEYRNVPENPSSRGTDLEPVQASRTDPARGRESRAFAGIRDFSMKTGESSRKSVYPDTAMASRSFTGFHEIQAIRTDARERPRRSTGVWTSVASPKGPHGCVWRHSRRPDAAGRTSSGPDSRRVPVPRLPPGSICGVLASGDPCREALWNPSCSNHAREARYNTSLRGSR